MAQGGGEILSRCWNYFLDEREIIPDSYTNICPVCSTRMMIYVDQLYRNAEQARLNAGEHILYKQLKEAEVWL